MKYLALVDRSAPRYLIDLSGLAEAGHLDAESIDVIRCIRRWEPKDFELARAADKARRGWIGDRAHQMASVPDFEAVADGLRRVLSIAAGWSPSPDSDQESRSDR